MLIFFDLDGPILDVSEKYYRVYADILSLHGFNHLPKSEYWTAKRQKISDSEILARTEASSLIEEYQLKRKRIIESDKYLKYDIVQKNAVQVLKKLSTKTPLVLVTLRSFHNQLSKELLNFGLTEYFHAILTSGEDIKPRWKIKYNLINDYLRKNKLIDHLDNIMIGDTETDILAGKHLGMKTIGVSFGIRNRNLLLSLEPDLLFDTPSELSSYLKGTYV